MNFSKGIFKIKNPFQKLKMGLVKTTEPEIVKN
ncbi:Uncharacterised protein [Acinetobacter baumannii]|nr:Uncharacterised protein [Acinetobacter baumannii]